MNGGRLRFTLLSPNSVFAKDICSSYLCRATLKQYELYTTLLLIKLFDVNIITLLFVLLYIIVIAI